MKKTINGVMLNLIFLLPYCLTYVLLFLEFSSKYSFIHSKIVEATQILTISSSKMYFLIVLMILFGSLIILFVLFLILKLFLLFGDRNEESDQHLFRSMVSSMTLANVILLLVNSFINIEISYRNLSLISSFLEVIIFIVIHYLTTKNTKNTLLLLLGKFIIYLLNLFYLIYYFEG
jgi:uncharacterized protein YacL